VRVRGEKSKFLFLTVARAYCSYIITVFHAHTSPRSIPPTHTPSLVLLKLISMIPDSQDLARRLYNPVNSFCGAAALDGDLSKLWSCFGTGAVLNIVLCLIVFAISEPLLKLFFGGFFEIVKAKKPHHSLSMKIEVVILVNATVTSSIVAWETILLYKIAGLAPKSAFELPARPSLWLATGAMVGFMLWHGTMMLIFRSSVEKTIGRAMFRTVTFHHVFSILLFPISLRVELGCYFVALLVLSEITAVPFAFRTFGLRMGQPFSSSLWFNCSSLLWLFMWFVARVMPMSSMLHVLSLANWEHLDIVSYYICWFSYGPLIMHSGWTLVILQNVYKQLTSWCFGGDSSSSSSSLKQNKYAKKK